MNAFGDIDDGAGPSFGGSFAVPPAPFDYSTPRLHTTIGVVLTNARLDKIGCHIVAQGAHDGLARALTPPHTRYDRDAMIAATTGSVDTDVDTVRLMALQAVAAAIRSVRPKPGGLSPNAAMPQTISD